MDMLKIVLLIAVLVSVIVCYAVTTSYTYIGIGNTDDASVFYNFGYPLGTGIFALATAIAFACTMPEDDTTLALAVLIGITAAALSIGTLATGSITH
jgi:hypothetical protein